MSPHASARLGITAAPALVLLTLVNWTTSAERRNRENLLILDCPSLAALFESEWESITPTRP